MKGWKAAVVALFLVGLIAGTAAAVPTKPIAVSPVQEKNYGLLTPGLFKKIQGMNWNQDISTVIMFNSPADRDRAVQILKIMGAEIKYSYKIIPAVAVKIKVKDLLLVAGMIDSGFFGNSKLSGVRFIQEDYKVQAADSTSVAQIQADAVWNLGYDGTGIVVAVIDTGIDANHPDLQGKVIAWYDAVNGKTTPYDDNGHGTHVAGIVAGTGAASNGQYIGVAPGAKLVGVKVLAADGSGSISDIIAGVDWVVQNKDAYGIKVINLSLGSSQSSDGTDSLSQAVNAAWDAGLVVCVAAGNSGPNTYTVGSPAAASKVITVGAVDSTDTIASFSSRGPTADGRLKPEVVAPGVDIIAPRAAGTSMGTPIDTYYTKASGTSMATPHVAGVAALLLQAHPDWTNSKIKTALIETADIVAPAEIADIAYGAGRVNVYKAINYDNYAKLVFTGSVADKGSVSHTFDISGATFVTATLYWDNSASDIDLYLYDPNGNQVDYSYTSYYGFEKVGYYNPTAGTWTVKVVSYSGAANYQVDVVSDGTLSQSTGTTPTPTPTPTPTTDSQTFTGYVHDWYDKSDSFTMTVNSGATKITGDLTFDTSLHDLDLYLYDPNGNLVDRSETSTSYEHVEYLNPAPGTWKFIVYAYNTYGWASYQLDVVVYYG
ncbi:alkaline serine protease [Thermococcus sp. GR7]|uniref:S8 family serine peptidase n=1 Tax=unclassified Thermococcus TaxID=2627626 RepID=UPI00142F4A4F|nr:MULTISPECIES: S8 family serine peptidase [unclassified Thermococcus]NJE46809.1 alkaline serine protease [Thermococcus sp. GR7]NJE77763.1 alkaline serine protease [Thermococcus sp. GR4]NJF23397.1 alkaline serine protease [Thermococcus sp. GR5]